MSILETANHHGISSTDMFHIIYPENVIIDLLKQSFSDEEFTNYSYDIYKKWYARTQTKLGQALK
jgi:hypothetical protein